MSNLYDQNLKNILIVEDAPTQRAVLINLTKELGYNPICPSNFDSTILNLIKENKILLVLLDLILLDDDGHSIGDGFQICQEIKNHNQEVKVIVITAESDIAARLFAESQGADGFLNKPFRIEDLEESLKKLTN